MTTVTTTAAQQARAAARVALDRNWPVARGVELPQEVAREAARRAAGGIHSPFDHATADAILADFIAGGMLTRRVVESPRREFLYSRPLEDVDPNPPQRPEAPVTMWHPADGSEPRPYADVLREQAEAAARAQQTPPTADHGAIFDE